MSSFDEKSIVSNVENVNAVVEFEQAENSVCENDSVERQDKNSYFGYNLITAISIVCIFVSVFYLSCVTCRNANATSEAYSFAVAIAGDSMAPTLTDGTCYLGEPCEDTELERGMIVVVLFKDTGIPLPEWYTGNVEDFYYIKRVIGLPGDTLFYDEELDTLYVNGEEYNESYLISQDYDWDIGTFVVPEGSVFLMGDNRKESYDSRDIGALPIDSVSYIIDPDNIYIPE